MSNALMSNYGERTLAFERGEGAYLYSTDGRRFLDFASGIAVTALGHCHPHLVAALKAQTETLWHTSNLFRIPGQERLAERLAANSFADRVFFCNSGVEAFEGAVKLARKYQDDRGQPGRWRIITCEGAFHGRSLAAIAASGNEKYLKGFSPVAPGFSTVAFNNLNELRAAITDETAAIMIEPIQGEGGINPAQLEYLERLREVCDEFGLLLIFDEIQCGIGRTGKLFAHEWCNARPDIMLLAKGLGGGFPVGAILATEAVSKSFTPGSHGTTFGGNPLAMAVGNAVLDVLLADGFLDQVVANGKILKDGLAAMAQRHPAVIAEVRGTGLMLGLKLVIPNLDFIARLRGEGMLAVPASDNVVRLLPPLIIGKAEVQEALDKLERCCVGLAEAA